MPRQYKLNTKNKVAIHQSDIRRFKTCRMLWDFSSPLRMNREPDWPIGPFFLGEGIHVALDYLYGRGLDPIDTFDKWYLWRMAIIRSGRTLTEEKEAFYNDQIALGQGMLEHYMTAMPPSKDEFDVVATETRFEIPIFTPTRRSSPKFYASGRFDGVLRDKRGGYWLFEHKTYKTITDDTVNSFELDMQAGLYLLAAQRMFGEPFKGILYNLVRKKIPTRPRLLKRGSLSVAKDIDTTYAVYLATIREHELDFKDYIGILQRLNDRGNTFFRRPKIRRSPRELAQLERYIYEVAREMTNPHVRIYPTDHWLECNRCSFREACLTRLAGHDPSDILAANFRTYQERLRFNLDTYEAQVKASTPIKSVQSVTIKTGVRTVARVNL